MSLEKLLESIPPSKKFQHPTQTESGLAGFCLHFSPDKEIWTAGYGRKHCLNDKKVGTGYSIIEAVDDFIAKQKDNE